VLVGIQGAAVADAGDNPPASRGVASQQHFCFDVTEMRASAGASSIVGGSWLPIVQERRTVGA